ncbi:MAG TPA: cupredoxin family protein [Rubrivivax sp.]|nr:cupredoxin family protein [Pseudomonadota bacterium]HOW48121.1 cupredoxin family protein [Rubrivivax sp.]HRY86618.1 cupredoxin family protein [Rubrivivax sp.]HRZ59410.1 cupredoxin family protein [Rubrivivax sp.]
MNHRRTLLKAASAALLAAAAGVRAHGDAEHAQHAQHAPAPKEQHDWGVAGDAQAVARTIEVRMGDDMRFTPARIDLRLGETVRFVAVNDGRLMHEFVIGTRRSNEAHAAMMLKAPGMEHDEPYMAHVPPGRRGEIVWRFNRAGQFEFACLIAGHYQAGMVGAIHVRA